MGESKRKKKVSRNKRESDTRGYWVSEAITRTLETESGFQTYQLLVAENPQLTAPYKTPGNRVLFLGKLIQTTLDFRVYDWDKRVIVGTCEIQNVKVNQDFSVNYDYEPILFCAHESDMINAKLINTDITDALDGLVKSYITSVAKRISS